MRREFWITNSRSATKLAKHEEHETPRGARLRDFALRVLRVPSRLRDFATSRFVSFACLRAFAPSRLRASCPSRAFAPSRSRFPSRLHDPIPLQLPRNAWARCSVYCITPPTLLSRRKMSHARHMSLRRVSLVWRLVIAMRSAIISGEGLTVWGRQSGSHDPKDLFSQQQRIRRRCLLWPEIQVITHQNTVIGGLGEV